MLKLPALKLSEFEQLVHFGDQMNAWTTPAAQAARRAFAVGVQDETIHAILENHARPLRRKLEFGLLPPFKPARLAKGIRIGKGLFGEPIHFDVSQLPLGLGIFAATGGGKTNLLILFALEIASAGCAVWLTDLYKSQLRHLVPLLASRGVHLVVIRTRDWKFNPLQAGDLDPQIYLPTAVDVISRALELPDRAKTVFWQACFQLYKKFGAFDGNPKAWPTLFHVFEVIYAATEINAAAREAIIDRLGSFLTSLTPGCGAYLVGWNPIDLAKQSIVFELNDASERVKQVIPEICLFSLFHHAYQHGSFNGPPKLALFFDDSQRFFGTDAAASGEISTKDELAAIVRGSGLCLCPLAQSPGRISRGLMANLGNKVMGVLGAHQDLESLGADMGMNHQQVAWAQRCLTAGTFVGSFAGHYREPFVFTVDQILLPTTVTVTDVIESQKPLARLPVVPAPEFAGWEPRHFIDLSTAAASQIPPTTPGPVPTYQKLTERAKCFLKAVVDQPGQASSFYAKIVGLNGKLASAVRQELVGGGLIQEHSLATGTRGRASIIIEPLQASIDLVADWAKENSQ